MIHKLLASTTSIGTFSPPTDSFSVDSATDASGASAAANLETFISNAIGVITLLGGLFFIFYFIMGGVGWITAGGEQGKVTKARDQMVQSVIGMVVIIISYGLIGIIGAILGFDFLNPGCQLLHLVNPTTTC